MKDLKKLFLFLAMVFALAACGKANETTDLDSKETEEAQVETSEELTEEAKTEESKTEEADADKKAISFKDDFGREIFLEGPAKTIVVSQPSSAEILAELGLKDRIVGRGEFVNYPEDLEEIEMVGSGQSLNAEKIIELDPDLVVLDEMDKAEDIVKQLEDAGLAVMVSGPKSIDEIYKNIEDLGLLTGEEEGAKDLVENMKSSFDELKAKVEDVEIGPSAYFEISPLEYGLWTAGNNTFFAEIADMLKIENSFDDLDGFAEISEEEVIDRNPDIIITTTAHYDGPSPEEEIIARPGWDGITAVANENVHAVNSDVFSRPGPRLIEAAQSLFDIAYGN